MSKEKTFISSNLKYLRTKKRKSLNDIAAICNKTNVAIHYWEDGAREPNAIDIAKLANYFQITVDDFILTDLRSNDNVSIVKNKTISDDELEHRLQKLSEKECIKIIFDKDDELTEEELNQIVSHARFIKEQHYKQKNK
ncbi:MAG: helix-turn-helix transcriptional regulator [Bacilli bacterium]|nr:helix-turn-helix transcriptional regulator [Bacilli bacterium]